MKLSSRQDKLKIMKNKTLGLTLMWTLIVALFVYFVVDEDFAGLIILANWVFVFIAGYRLINLKDKK
jgi:hypothetical protein